MNRQTDIGNLISLKKPLLTTILSSLSSRVSLALLNLLVIFKCALLCFFCGWNDGGRNDHHAKEKKLTGQGFEFLKTLGSKGLGTLTYTSAIARTRLLLLLRYCNQIISRSHQGLQAGQVCTLSWASMCPGKIHRRCISGTSSPEGVNIRRVARVTIKHFCHRISTATTPVVATCVLYVGILVLLH